MFASYLNMKKKWEENRERKEKGKNELGAGAHLAGGTSPKK
jgi:hypothetical protein